MASVAEAYARFMGAGWASLEARLRHGKGSREHVAARAEVERLKAKWITEDDMAKKVVEKWACFLGCGKTFASCEASERHMEKCKGPKWTEVKTAKGGGYVISADKAVPCILCGKTAVLPLSPPDLAKQTDGTTHVCHPSIGGCNHGFAMKVA